MAAPLAPAEEPVTLYDSDPAHLWNRLHRALFIRTSPSGREFGHDDVDILLRPRSATHLLAAPSREPALAVLREFVEKNGAKLVTDATRRALLQHDLWAAFDWAADANGAHRPPEAEPALRELRPALARVLSQLTLAEADFRALPDTFAAALASKKFAATFDPAAPETPFLPKDLLDPEGEWVCLSEQVNTQGRTFHKLVPDHADRLSRSVFAVFIRVPEGRAATKTWLDRLINFGNRWEIDGQRLRLHRNLPEFPHGTQLALLRRAMVIGEGAALVPTRVVESLQMRTFHSPPGSADGAREYAQEFVLTRKGGEPASLRPIGKGEKGFSEIGDLADPFEEQGPGRFSEPSQQVILSTCIGCHHNPGLPSFNTYTRSFGPQLTTAPGLIEGPLSEREDAAIFWKQTRYDWGLLRGLMAR
ncbi:MAG: hypothetical protein ABIZ56_08895 [Chthoniobacteraceae bacterium]